MNPQKQRRTPTSTKGIAKRRWIMAAVLGFGVLVNYFDRVNLSVAKEALTKEFGLSNVSFGYLLSAYNWTYAALQLPSGVLLDRFGVAVVGRTSAIIWSLACLGGALAPGARSFFASRLLLGVGEAPTFPANAKATGNWFPRQERSLATAVFDSAAKFSTAIGTPLIGMFLIHFGWRMSFGATAVASFLFFLAFYFIYRDPQDDPKLSPAERTFIEAGGALGTQQGKASKAKAGAPLSYLLTRRKIVGLAIGFAAYNYCFYLLLAWLPSYFTGALHLNLHDSILFSAVPWLIAGVADLAVGGWMVDWLVQRFNDSAVRRTVLIGGMILGLGIVGAIYTTNARAAMWWISLSIGGLAVSAPISWSLPSLIAPTGSVGRVGSIMNFVSQLAALAAPIVTGYVIGSANDYARAFAVAAGMLVAGIVAYFFLLGAIEPLSEPAAAATQES
jgi:ACS family D-galactonate transporter-like MFS transporter